MIFKWCRKWSSLQCFLNSLTRPIIVTVILIKPVLKLPVMALCVTGLHKPGNKQLITYSANAGLGSPTTLRHLIYHRTIEIQRPPDPLLSPLPPPTPLLARPITSGGRTALSQPPCALAPPRRRRPYGVSGLLLDSCQPRGATRCPRLRCPRRPRWLPLRGRLWVSPLR